MNQVFPTIVAGVSVYVFGQVVQNFILKPIQSFRKVLVDVSHKVKFHSNVITNSGIKNELVQWASGDMRDLSCNLESKYLMIPFHRLFALLGLIPRRETIDRASSLLILLANAGGSQGNELRNNDSIEELKRLLAIDLKSKNFIDKIELKVIESVNFYKKTFITILKIVKRKKL